MSLRIYEDLEQGTPEWFGARCGLVTASVVGQLVSSRQPSAIEAGCPECGASAGDPCTGKRSPGPLKTLHPARASVARGMARVIAPATDDYSRPLAMSLVAERITGHVEHIFANADMERGTLSEPFARDIYAEHFAPVTEVGFMVRDFGGYRIGYSPDGLVGDGGLIEIKSPRQKKHLATILADEVPLEYMAQCQTGLLVSGREWIDFVSYNGGMPLYVKRVLPDEKWFDAITDAVLTFEAAAADMLTRYAEATANLPATERIDLFAEMEAF